MKSHYQEFKNEITGYWLKRPMKDVLFQWFWKIRKLELALMDKQIRKVEKDVKKGNKMKAEKDIKTLKKMDKKFDKKIDKAKKVMKGKC